MHQPVNTTIARPSSHTCMLLQEPMRGMRYKQARDVQDLHARQCSSGECCRCPCHLSTLALATEKRAELVEKVADVDEQLGELFLMEEPIDEPTLREAIR